MFVVGETIHNSPLTAYRQASIHYLVLKISKLLQPFPNRVFFFLAFLFHFLQHILNLFIAIWAVHIFVVTGLMHRYAEVYEFIDPVLNAYMTFITAYIVHFSIMKPFFLSRFSLTCALQFRKSWC